MSILKHTCNIKWHLFELLAKCNSGTQCAIQHATHAHNEDRNEHLHLAKTNTDAHNCKLLGKCIIYISFCIPLLLLFSVLVNCQTKYFG